MADDPAPRTVHLLYDGCTIAETIGLVTRLVDHGHDVVHVSVDGASVRDRSGLRLDVDAALGDVDPRIGRPPATVVVPGGNPDSIIERGEVAALLQAAAERGAVTAGICAGVAVLAAVGVTRGRRITHNYRSPWAPAALEEHVAHLWAGAEVEADRRVGVVVDGPLVTALPNAAIEFASAVCVRLGLLDPGRAALLDEHLRGHLVDELYGP